MAEETFGGNWTESKLKKVSKYLNKYMSILANQEGLTTGYIDAFAGTGYRAIREACPEESYLFDNLGEKKIEKYREGLTMAIFFSIVQIVLST